MRANSNRVYYALQIFSFKNYNFERKGKGYFLINFFFGSSLLRVKARPLFNHGL